MPRWCRGHSAGTSSACTPSDFPASEGCVPKIPRTRFCDPFDWLVGCMAFSRDWRARAHSASSAMLCVSTDSGLPARHAAGRVRPPHESTVTQTHSSAPRDSVGWPAWTIRAHNLDIVWAATRRRSRPRRSEAGADDRGDLRSAPLVASV